MKRVITSLSLLLLLLCGAQAQSISQYEYWTDDDYASRKVSSWMGGEVSLTINTASLKAGVHYLNFRACRDDGVWGNFYRYLYYIPTLKAVSTGEVTVEYWLDDNLIERQSKEASSGSLALTMDVSTLKPGVHYFNCTPIADSGERGNSERYLFYVPQAFDLANVSPVKGFEYWLDDNYAGKQVNQGNTQSPVLTIDIGGLTSGVHYFNCRVFNERGEYGNPVRQLFYIPQTSTPSGKLAKAEYWLDDDYQNKVVTQTSETLQPYTIDISHLTSGVHYFNYRAFDTDGIPGNWVRQVFYLYLVTDASVSDFIEYEYWIDSEDKVTGSSTTPDVVFNVDVSSLGEGKHTLNFRAKNVLDQWGDTYVEEFDLADVFNPDLEQCATPVVEVKDGTLNYSCATENVTYVTDISFAGKSVSSTENRQILSSQTVCNVSVYATKNGYNDSKTVEKEMVVNVGIKGDVNADGIVTITDAVGVVNLILDNPTASAPILFKQGIALNSDSVSLKQNSLTMTAESGQKCATPTIVVNGGIVNYSCATENVTYVTSITFTGRNIRSTEQQVVLSSQVVCNISVYATKNGYDNSDTVEREVVLNIGKKGDVNNDGKVTITDAVSVVNIILNNGETAAPALESPEVVEPE